MKIQIINDHYQIKIMIDNLPHLLIDKKEFVGYHSWHDSETECCIEFITKTNTILVEYDSKDKWLQMLKAINENI